MKKFLSGLILGIFILGIPIIINGSQTKTYIELKHNYKNCVIVKKGELFYKQFIIVRNPITKKESRVYVKPHVFYYHHIGDTIK